MIYITQLIFLSLIILLSSCQDKPKQSSEQDIYDKYDLKKADELVIDAFKTSDVVLIGENHFIGEHVNFISELIPKLHKNGIYVLYSEFISVDYTKQIEELINAEYFDEDKAKNLLLLNLWDWPYREYMEIYRAAWALNKTLVDEPKFRIIGLDKAHNYSAIQSPDDWNNPENRKAFFVEWEDAWARRVIDNTVNKGEKALVYCGINHALTYYNQPILKDGEFFRMAERDRVGQYLYNELGDKCTFLSFHIPWDSKDGETENIENPLNGLLDQLVDSLDQEHKKYGFYTRTSKLGKIVDTTHYYSRGYPNFNLSMLCDGYLVVSPICDLNICEFIPNFIDSSNIDFIRPQVKVWENIDSITIQHANQLLQEMHKRRVEEFNERKGLMNCQ